MAEKYYIEYNDVSNQTHRLEIYDDDFSGTSTLIGGSVFMEYPQTTNLLDPIKGSGLRIELEADAGLTYADLYSEYEKDFSVIYYLDGSQKFEGWINPEGWYEDFVNDKWKVSFDCIDGLSFLENLSYVQASGLNYTGKETLIKTVSNCLLKTGIEQDIRVDVGIVYSGLTETLDPFANIQMDADRFIKDDNNTVMSCKEVLSSVLELFTATLSSVDGVWWITKPNQLFSSSTINYFAYDYLGVSKTGGTLDASFDLGSEVNGYFPHHCSANQSMSNEKSIGGYRVNYKYGFQKGLLDNKYLSGNGTTIDGWTIDNSQGLTIPASNLGFNVHHDPVYIFNRKIYSDNMALDLDDPIRINVKFDSSFPTPPTVSSEEYAVMKIIIVGTSTTYYYTGTSWSTSDSQIQTRLSHFDETKELSFDLEMPVTGDLRIEFWMPIDDAANPTSFDVYYREVEVLPLGEETNTVEGELHTLQRTTKPNSKVDDVKEVFNGDNESSVYVGAIYKTDGTTLTSTWKRKGVTESMAILRLMGEETLRLKASTRRVFRGDVFGFFSFLSVVTINGVSGVFLPVQYSYDTRNNIVQAEFKQIFGSELTDIEYQKTLDYGNVVKPTIKG